MRLKVSCFLVGSRERGKRDDGRYKLFQQPREGKTSVLSSENPAQYHLRTIEMLSIKLVFALLPSVLLALADSSTPQSICDKYTTALLKDDTPANQYTLLTLLVNTVVIGNYTQPNVGVALPGILAPGVYGGEQVNLLPYFNGCLESTNVNNKPASVNFLDGGGAAPLTMDLPANNMNSNQ